LERTLISWNVANLITIPLMAALGFVLIATVYQLARRALVGKETAVAAPTEGGY